MEATFILALLSHGYKVRASTLYHLLKGKRTSSVLIYGFLYDSTNKRRATIFKGAPFFVAGLSCN